MTLHTHVQVLYSALFRLPMVSSSFGGVRVAFNPTWYPIRLFPVAALPVPSSASCCPWVACGLWRRENKLFLTQLPVHQRMNANGNGYQIIYFPETITQ
jgi:hypothetical protein